MSHENPTPLRVGASGTLNGWPARVAGRLVMSVEVEGETYWWSEFYLVDGIGKSATLVFEEGEDGPEWKLFREFTPAQPMTARAAAAKNVGDHVNLDGKPAAITLVDQSRVEFIEGQAPEGVEIGDVANYFNADTGSRMLVASWTGDEIEFYEGLDTPAESVAAAFGFAGGLPPRTGSDASSFRVRNDENSAGSLRSEGSPIGSGSSGLLLKVVLGLLGCVALFGAYSCSSLNRSKPVAGAAGQRAGSNSVPASRFAIGTHGTLGGRTYEIVGQGVVEIARTVGRHQRREYLLREGRDSPALLINGLNGGAKEWHLLRATPSPNDLTPYTAAAKRKGETIPLERGPVRVAELFQSKAFASAQPGAISDTPLSATVEYGFVARNPDQLLFARWDQQKVQFLVGTAMTEADVVAAFGPATVTSSFK